MKHIDYRKIEFKKTGWGVKGRVVVNVPEINIVNLYLEPGEVVPPHKTPVHVHFQVMEGVGTVVIDEERYIVKEGDIVFSPLMIPHSLEANQGKPFSVFVIKTPNPGISNIKK